MCRNHVQVVVATVLVCVLGVAAANDAATGGIKGEYFNYTWCDGPVVATRIDSEINFDWGNDAPAPGVHPDYFSVRWTGDLEVPVTATYVFTVRTDAMYCSRSVTERSSASIGGQPPTTRGRLSWPRGRYIR